MKELVIFSAGVGFGALVVLMYNRFRRDRVQEEELDHLEADGVLYASVETLAELVKEPLSSCSVEELRDIVSLVKLIKSTLHELADEQVNPDEVPAGTEPIALLLKEGAEHADIPSEQMARVVDLFTLIGARTAQGFITGPYTSLSEETRQVLDQIPDASMTLMKLVTWAFDGDDSAA